MNDTEIDEAISNCRLQWIKDQAELTQCQLPLDPLFVDIGKRLVNLRYVVNATKEIYLDYQGAHDLIPGAISLTMQNGETYFIFDAVVANKVQTILETYKIL